MAALTFTAASVVLVGGVQEKLTAGGTIARGNLVRKDANNQVVVASNNTAANADAYGIALDDGAAGQPVVVAKLEGGGYIDGVASNCAAGKPLFAGVNGAINPVDDIAGGEFVTLVGIGVTTGRFNLGRIWGGVAAAGAVT